MATGKQDDDVLFPETVSEEPDVSSAEIDWSDFLANQPPGHGNPVIIANALGSQNYLEKPDIKLYCDSEDCDGVMFFENKQNSTIRVTESYQYFHLYYACKNCCKTEKIISICIRIEDKNEIEVVIAIKLGENPPFRPHVPLPERERSRYAGIPLIWHMFMKALLSFCQFSPSKSAAMKYEVLSSNRG